MTIDEVFDNIKGLTTNEKSAVLKGFYWGMVKAYHNQVGTTPMPSGQELTTQAAAVINPLSDEDINAILDELKARSNGAV